MQPTNNVALFFEATVLIEVDIVSGVRKSVLKRWLVIHFFAENS